MELGCYFTVKGDEMGLRVFVRIRIFRIGGIFRISIRRIALFVIDGNPSNPNVDDERLTVEDARRGGILKIL